MSQKERFDLLLQVYHPSWSPEVISHGLECDPDLAQAVGTPRRTLTDAPLRGVYRETSWSRRYARRGEREFTACLGEILQYLEKRKTFVLNLVESGGKARLYLRLPGDVNLGDDLSSTLLRRMADLKIILGIEVFPKFE